MTTGTEEAHIDAAPDSPDGCDRHSPDPDRKPKPAQADLLVSLCEGVEFSHTPAGEAFATIEVNGHLETHALSSAGFKNWLKKSFYRKYKKAVRGEAIDAAIGVMAGKAIFDGEAHPVFLRVAYRDGSVYVDLGNDNWEVVRITREGWETLKRSPVKFRRPAGTLALPTPKPGGNVDELFDYLNISDDTSKKLVVGFLLGAFLPEGGFPLLEITGGQGTAKSMASEFIKSLVDPQQVMKKSPPKDERDLALAANNSYLPLFDNISCLSANMSDYLCRMTTGGGFSTRKLYSDGDEFSVDYRRPGILNGINDAVVRPDLLERTLCIELHRIPDDRRKDEATLRKAFSEAAPRILGALFDAVAVALKNLPNLTGKSWPRLADFGKWVTAAEPALGWEQGSFLDAYRENEQSADQRVLEADDSLVRALQMLLKDSKVWRGTATELHRLIEWVPNIKSAVALGMKLGRLEKPLRSVGIEILKDHQGTGRYLTVRRSQG